MSLLCLQLVLNVGDFLVRESQGSPGQYVLTGVQQNSRKHLLLIDPEGVVSTFVKISLEILLLILQSVF